MREQKFVHGDVVMIAKKMPPEMSHFESGQKAYVLGSYAEEYGTMREEYHQYHIVLAASMKPVSWYQECVLKKIGSISPRKLLKLRLANERKEFEKQVLEMKERGLEPYPGRPNTWKRIEV